MLLLSVILLGVIIWLLNYYWVNSQFKYWEKNGIPYSKITPFRQILHQLFTKRGIMKLFMDDFEKLKGFKFAGQFQLLSPVLIIIDPDLVHRVCIKDFSYFMDRSFPMDETDLFGGSIGSLTGDRWRILRHKLTPTFTSGKLKMMFAPIMNNCNEVVSFINKKIGQDIEARDFMFKYIINVIGNVSFGLKVDALNDETEKENEFLKISRVFFKPSFTLFAKFMITLTMPKIKKFIKFSMVNKNIETFFKTLVKDLIQHREKTGEIRKDFLQLMLNLKKKEDLDTLSTDSTKNQIELKEKEMEPEDTELLDQLKYMKLEKENYKSVMFTDDCIVSQTFMFLSAGSETTAAALSSVLYELAVNPLLQNKVQEELDFVLSKREFNYEAIKQMVYMEQFINESLRLHPPAPGVSRICTQDYQIPDTNVVIKKGSVIAIPIQQLMKNPLFFPEPETFNPDRFENIDLIHPAVFLPFGIGPRMCIAKRLAILEMKMVVAAILQNFTVKLSPKTKLPITIQKSSFIGQHVEGGIWVQFEARKKSV